MRPYHLVALVPVVALCLTVFLPFVNTTTTWFGIPPMFVWSMGWVLAIIPTLRTVERMRRRDEQHRAGGEQQ